MTTISGQLYAHNGKYLVFPPMKEGQSGWGVTAEPQVTEAGGNASMRVPVNTKFVDFDRTFIYGYVEGKFSSATKANIGLQNKNVEETITYGAAAGAVGDTTIGLLTPVTDETTAAANIFAGGLFMPRTNPYGGYRIISNTAYASGVVESSGMDIVIEEPGLGAIVTASQTLCKLDRNPYTGLYSNWAGGDAYMTVMGVTLIDPTASTYQWVQTWGPCMLMGGEQAGKAGNLRDVWWAIDGSLIAGAQIVPSATSQHQYAGVILGDTSAATYCWHTAIKLER